MPVAALVVFRYGDRSRECRYNGFVADDAYVYAAVQAVVANAVPGAERGLVRDRNEHRGKVKKVLVFLFFDHKCRGLVLLLSDDFKIDTFLVEEDCLGERLGVVCVDCYFACIVRDFVIRLFFCCGFLGCSFF